jgi:hypothetical protein
LLKCESTTHFNYIFFETWYQIQGRFLL